MFSQRNGLPMVEFHVSGQVMDNFLKQDILAGILEVIDGEHMESQAYPGPAVFPPPKEKSIARLCLE